MRKNTKIDAPRTPKSSVLCKLLCTLSDMFLLFLGNSEYAIRSRLRRFSHTFALACDTLDHKKTQKKHPESYKNISETQVVIFLCFSLFFMTFGTLPACESVPPRTPLRGFPQTPFLSSLRSSAPRRLMHLQVP